MVARSIRSGAGKACSVALAVTLGTMGITPIALADATGGGDSGTITAQVGRSYLPKTVDAADCDFVVDGIGYTTETDEYTYSDIVKVRGIVNPDNVPNDLVIPSSFLVNEGEWNETKAEVTAITADADLGAANSVVLPDTLSTIETSDDGHAFAGGSCEYYFLGGAPTIGEDSGGWWGDGDEASMLSSAFAAVPQSGKIYIASNKIEDWILTSFGDGLTATGFDIPTSISITSTQATISDKGLVDIPIGGKVKLDGTSQFSDPESAAAKLCPVALSKVKWVSENTDRATVSSDGTVSLLDRAEVGDTIVIKASNAAGCESNATVRVVEAAEQRPAPTKIDISDCVFEKPNAYSPIQDMALPVSIDPEVRIFKDYGSSNPLVKDADFQLSYKDSEGTPIAKISDITESGAYKLVITGIGDYTGSVEFDFNVISSSLVAGDWEYALDGDNAVIVSYKGEKGSGVDASIPPSINNHPVTSIAAGALTGEFGVIRVPASVTSLASGAMDGLNCGHVMFAGDIPSGTNVATSSSIVGIYFADTANAAAWQAENTWAFAWDPTEYDASWRMDPVTDATGRFAWKVTGHEWAANDGGDHAKLSIPARFAGAGVITMDENAIADASLLKELRVPDSIRNIADGAVKGLSPDAGVFFDGLPPAGASYGNGGNPEFQGAQGAKAASKFFYLPGNKDAWTVGEPGTKWIAGYGFSAEDIYKCTPSDYAYLDLGDGKYSIIAYGGEDEAVRLPAALNGDKVNVYKETVSDENGIPVASYEEREVTGSVFEIGDRAFRGSSIVQMAIPDSIEKIGEGAFLQADIASIDFEGKSKLKSIGEIAFARSNLVSITIPAGVDWIGEDAFVTPTMARIGVAEGNATYSSDDGILFSKDKKTLVFYP